jgi:hypothetical protein
MLHQIGAIGYAVIAVVIWLLGIVVAGIAIGQSLIAGRGYTGRSTRDWPVIAFRTFMLLVWLMTGFMVMAMVKT